MKKSDDFIADRLMWKALKHNLPTKFSSYHRDCSPAIQQYLASFLGEENSGLPVLYFTKPTGEWTLVCTREVICNSNPGIIRVAVDSIQKFYPAAVGELRSGQSVNADEVKKAEWDELIIVDRSGNKYKLHTNKGADFFALWNILLMVVRLN